MNEFTTLKSVSVSKLFGRFDYNLTFKNIADESKALTIITAPNGYGKSTILKLIDDLLRGNYLRLARTSFHELILKSSEDISILVRRKVLSKNDTENESVFLVFELFSKGESQSTETWNLNIEEVQRNEIDEDGSISRRFDSSVIEYADRILGLRRVGVNVWRDPKNGRNFSRSEITEMFEVRRLKSSGNVEPSWLIEFRKSLPVLYISANRLRVDLDSQVNRRGQSGEKVEAISDKVLDQIRNFNRTYAEAGRRLEQDFASRVIKALGDSSPVSEVEVSLLMEQVRKREEEYQELGLLSSGQTARSQDFPKDNSAFRVLKTYLEDIDKKLAGLEEPAHRLKLFVQTLNSMLVFKKIALIPDAGFEVIGDDGKNIPLKSLSSGEQHLIVLLGELIFESINISAVLLDEPEISFHPAWQDVFVGILEKIIFLNKCMIVMATHSPTLIGDKWESVIELAEQVRT